MNRHDDMLSVHDIRLADMDLRFQVLETASYNGTLIWKIRDYKRRKQEAVAAKTLSLYSQPFYTGYFGYKMCARIYLNGDGMGKGTHLSLFFVVMRGEYDALLPWPFKQKVGTVFNSSACWLLFDNDTRLLLRETHWSDRTLLHLLCPVVSPSAPFWDLWLLNN